MPYDPPLVITAGYQVGGTTQFAEGEDENNNPFTRMCKEALGIEWRVTLTYGESDREAPWTLAMASGELPDVCCGMPISSFVSAMEADLLQDVTDNWEATASPKWLREPAESPDSLAFAYMEVDGRKYGIPTAGPAAMHEAMLWVRKDWLDELGLEEPQTLDQVKEVALAFKQADLGQGSGGTTLGLLGSSEFITWFGSLDPIFGGFGVQPTFWQKDGEGLSYASVRPEMKDALLLLRDWYASGVLEPDFYTIEPFDSKKFIASNRCGLMYSQYYCPRFGINESLQNDPDAEWVFGDIPAGPAGKWKRWSNPWEPIWVTFPKGFEHVDEVIRHNNWWAELTQDPSRRWHGWEGPGYSYTIDDGRYAKTSTLTHKWMIAASGGTGTWGDPNTQYNEFKWQEENWKDIPEGDRDAFQQTFFDDPIGTEEMFRAAYMYAVENAIPQGIRDEFTRLPTETMIRAGTDLIDLENETFLGIITGQLAPEAFEEFVSTYERLGGAAIHEEVNDWYASKS
ncbi:MAG: hypothetical protein ACOX2R_00670 [Anaerolineae bacterium]